MNIDKVIITKRCFYHIAVAILILLMFPFAVYIGCKYNIIFLYTILIICLIGLVFSVPALLAFLNEKIIISDDEIIHISSTGNVAKHTWGHVKKVYMSNCGQYTNSMVILLFYDQQIIKIPYYLPGYDSLLDYLKERGILGLFSDNPLYAYVNMDNRSKYYFNPSSQNQFFEDKKIDISEVISNVQNTEYLAAAYKLNQLTDIGMFESFLYICQMKKNI